MNSIILTAAVLLFISTLVQPRNFDVLEVEENSEGYGHRESNIGDHCHCENYCWKSSETYNITCPTNHTVYLECQETFCTTKSCPANQILNHVTLKCASCPTGKHLNKAGTYCVCNEGTRNDWDSINSCVPCPTGAVVTPDDCYCNPNEALDLVRNTCRECPEDAYEDLGSCRCKNRRQFFNNLIFSCGECPGVLVDDGFGRDDFGCHCQGDNEIFNPWSATCVTCPPNSSRQLIFGAIQYCHCTDNQFYSSVSNLCIDRLSSLSMSP